MHLRDVAIHAPHATPLYSTDRRGLTGGGELQMFQLARELARRGMRVAHIVFDDGTLPNSVEGVDIIPLPPRTEASGGIFGQLRTLKRALQDANGRVVIQRNAGFETGCVAAFACAQGSRFIFSSSSDGDFTGHAFVSRRLVSRFAFGVGLRIADAVVVQTEDQLALAPAHVRRRGTVIRSFCQPAPPQFSNPEAFLWIGGLISYKDPLSYLRLAELVPEAMFWMVATDRAPAWADLAHQVRREADRLPNLKLLPPRPREELFRLYHSAVAVVNTSQFEGFPNTFLEGWVRGVPALSLAIDPDRLIQRHSLGAVADGSVERLATLAREMWGNRSDRDGSATMLRTYVSETHASETIGGRWSDVVRTLSDVDGQPASTEWERWRYIDGTDHDGLSQTDAN
jgi:glycosyltransferase involved in cell wall biosynthesis